MLWVALKNKKTDTDRANSGCINRLGLVLLLVGIPGVCSQSAVVTATFQGIGDLPGGNFWSRANAISADGLVVVGFGRNDSGFEPVRWTLAEGIVGLGFLPGGDSGVALGVSADGSVVVGGGNSSFGEEAFRWTQTDGMVGLGDLPGGDFFSRAFDVSADGSVVVGRSHSDTQPNAEPSEAFHWNPVDGMVGLGGGIPITQATAVSADGLVVVGDIIHGDSGLREAFRWTLEEGIVALGDLYSGSSAEDSEARDVSADGSVIVGLALSDNANNNPEAFRWTSNAGMGGLGDLPGGLFLSEARGVSAHGLVIVGESMTDSGMVPFIWDNIYGIQSLRFLFEDFYDLDLTGWILEGATGISNDGTTIVGWGINPSGDREGWIATIPRPLSINSQQHDFNIGETLIVSLSINNYGLPVTVDFYSGAMLPDNTTVFSFTSQGMTPGNTIDYSTLIPFDPGVDLSTPFFMDEPNFLEYTWTGNEPHGHYILYLAVVVPGAFIDGTNDPGDMYFLEATSIHFPLENP